MCSDMDICGGVQPGVLASDEPAFDRGMTNGGYFI